MKDEANSPAANARLRPVPLTETFSRGKMLAADISDQISPSIERLKLAVGGQERFRLSNFGINEDGDVIGCIGLRCEEEKMKKPALAFGVVVTRMEPSKPVTARGSVVWSVPWVRDRQDGFTAYEAKTECVKFDGNQLPREFLLELPRLEKAFIEALRRGRPPGVWLSFWRKCFSGVPMPQTIRISTRAEPAVTDRAGAPSAPAGSAGHL